MRNGQANQRKTEKFSVSEEKKFGKIDSWNATNFLVFRPMGATKYLLNLVRVPQTKKTLRNTGLCYFQCFLIFRTSNDSVLHWLIVNCEFTLILERLPGFLKTAELLKIKGLGDQSLYKNNDQEEENIGEVTILITHHKSLNVITLVQTKSDNINKWFSYSNL